MLFQAADVSCQAREEPGRERAEGNQAEGGQPEGLESHRVVVAVVAHVQALAGLGQARAADFQVIRGALEGLAQVQPVGTHRLGDQHRIAALDGPLQPRISGVEGLEIGKELGAAFHVQAQFVGPGGLGVGAAGELVDVEQGAGHG